MFLPPRRRATRRILSESQRNLCVSAVKFLSSITFSSLPKFLYKYPQNEFPYQRLIEENRNAGKRNGEFELIDTGIFDDDKYFDVFVEYAKADVEDILIKITIANRGADNAKINVLPTVWFRNTWSWESSRFPIPNSQSVSAL